MVGRYDLAQRFDLLEHGLHGQVLGRAFRLKRGKRFGEGGEATVVGFCCVAGAVVARLCHGGTVAFVLFVLLDPKTLELVPLGESGVRVFPGIFLEFVFELTSLFNNR